MKFELNHLNKSALSVLLFVCVYHVINLALHGYFLICFIFLGASIISGRTLINQQHAATNLLYSHYFYALIAVWSAVFLMLFSANEQSTTLGVWFCILIFCTSILLKPNHARRLNLLVLIIYWLFSFLHSNSTLIFIESALALTIVVFIASMVQTVIYNLETKLCLALERDKLTGCIQPSAFKHELEQSVHLYNRYEIPFSLICIKYHSYFSTENDLQIWLKEVTHLYQSRLRKTDILCRFTDQKFMILLPGTNNKNSAALLLDLQNATNAYEFSFQKAGSEAFKKPRLNFAIESFIKNESFEEWFNRIQAP